MRNNCFKKNFIYVLLLSVGFAFINNGCEPLRKKFVRKKNVEDRDIQPVYKPVEYSKEEKLAKQRYRYHYSLSKVWMKELIVFLDEKTSKKKLIAVSENILIELKEMKETLNISKQMDLAKQIQKFEKIKERFNQSPLIRDDMFIKRELIKLEKELRKEFKYEKIENFIID